MRKVRGWRVRHSDVRAHQSTAFCLLGDFQSRSYVFRSSLPYQVVSATQLSPASAYPAAAAAYWSGVTLQPAPVECFAAISNQSKQAARRTRWGQ